MHQLEVFEDEKVFVQDGFFKPGLINDLTNSGFIKGNSF